MRKIVVVCVILITMLSFTFIKTTRIGVEKGGLVINKKAFGSSWTLKDFETCIGEANKIKDGYNRTHTYDDLGIILYEKKKDTVFTGKISEIQIYFDPSFESNERTPGSGFKGAVQIDGLKAKNSLASAEMKQQLKDWHETESFSPHNYRMVKENMYIYFRYNEDETQLQKISIGFAMY